MRKAGVWSAQAGEVDGGPAGSAHFRAQRRVLDRVPADVEPCLRCGHTGTTRTISNGSM